MTITISAPPLTIQIHPQLDTALVLTPWSCVHLSIDGLYQACLRARSRQRFPRCGYDAAATSLKDVPTP